MALCSVVGPTQLLLLCLAAHGLLLPTARANPMQRMQMELQKQIHQRQQELGHPYEDVDKDGQLSTAEVRSQWSQWMDGAMQAAKDKEWEKTVGLLHKVLHAPGPTEAQIRYNLGFALHKLSDVEGASELYGGTNFIAAAKGELDRSVEIAAEEGDTQMAERSRSLLKTLPKHVEAAEPFGWPEVGSGKGGTVRTDGRDAPNAGGPKKKKSKKDKKKKKKKENKEKEILYNIQLFFNHPKSPNQQ